MSLSLKDMSDRGGVDQVEGVSTPEEFKRVEDTGKLRKSSLFKSYSYISFGDRIPLSFKDFKRVEDTGKRRVYSKGTTS